MSAIGESESLDLELKRAQLRQLQLNNELLEEEITALRVKNSHDLAILQEDVKVWVSEDRIE